MITSKTIRHHEKNKGRKITHRHKYLKCVMTTSEANRHHEKNNGKKITHRYTHIESNIFLTLYFNLVGAIGESGFFWIYH
jgi:repressor of nif and glnA expression